MDQEHRHTSEEQTLIIEKLQALMAVTPQDPQAPVKTIFNAPDESGERDYYRIVFTDDKASIENGWHLMEQFEKAGLIKRQSYSVNEKPQEYDLDTFKEDVLKNGFAYPFSAMDGSCFMNHYHKDREYEPHYEIALRSPLPPREIIRRLDAVTKGVPVEEKESTKQKILGFFTSRAQKSPGNISLC